MIGSRADGFIRIDKRTARKMYNAGDVVYLCPHKLRPGDPWHPEIGVCFTDGDGAASAPVAFDQAVSQFEYYNCGYEAGYYSAFYIKRAV